MGPGLTLALRIAIAALAAVFLGSGSVVAFNRMKSDWFLDFDENDKSDEPRRLLPPKLAEADEAGRQRLPSTPWKYAFTGYFALTGLYLAIRGGSTAYEAAVLCVLFIVLEMAICDQLYQVVPDQLSIALAVSAIGFISFYEDWWEQPAGALTGFGISMVILLLGQLLFRTGSIGGADIKFFTCMGLVAGRTGIVIIFILTTLLFAVYSLIRIACGRGSIKDKNAMLPSACAAVTIYFLFLWSVGELLVIRL